MGDRPISNHEREWLSRELTAWASAGVVAPDQIERILGCYETVAATGQRKHSLARFVLQGLSALLVGLATLLLIGYNWDAMHWVAKLCLIFGGILGAHALGLYLYRKEGLRWPAELAFFLGCLLYGAGIWLVAQVFHLESHYPDGVWWWAVGVLPFALCLDTLLLHALLVGLLALWAGMEVFGFSHLPPWWGWNWWPNSAYSLPLLAAPGLVWAYRRGSAKAVTLYVALFAWWVVLQAMAWDLEWRSIYLVGTMGAIFLILAENHRHGSALAVPYRFFGTLMVGGALIPPSFASFHRETYYWWSRQVYWEQSFAELIIMLVLIASLLAFLLLLRPTDKKSTDHPLARVGEVLTRQWFPMLLILAMATIAILSLEPRQGALTATIVANAAMLGFAIYLMRVGLREEHGWLFTAGVVYFLLWSILRYVDLFGDAGGMLGASLMFFLCGATLFGLATYWGKRKELRHA